MIACHVWVFQYSGKSVATPVYMALNTTITMNKSSQFDPRKTLATLVIIY
jgi:hypothetical protein